LSGLRDLNFLRRNKEKNIIGRTDISYSGFARRSLRFSDCLFIGSDRIPEPPNILTSPVPLLRKEMDFL
jgi:hypothetical protein